MTMPYFTKLKNNAELNPLENGQKIKRRIRNFNIVIYILIISVPCISAYIKVFAKTTSVVERPVDRIIKFLDITPQIVFTIVLIVSLRKIKKSMRDFEMNDGKGWLFFLHVFGFSFWTLFWLLEIILLMFTKEN